MRRRITPLYLVTGCEILRKEKPMTDIQILTLALSVTLPILLALTALIHSNSRISDAKETLRAEIGEAKNALRLDIERVLSEIRQLRADIEKHELIKH